MSRSVNRRAMCPFFQEEAGCENMPPKMREAQRRVREKRQRCEGLTPDGKIFVGFNSKEERDGHRESFCYTYCWEGCPVAMMLLEEHGVRTIRGHRIEKQKEAAFAEIDLSSFL